MTGRHSPERWFEIDRLFGEALEQEAEAREDFIHRRAGPDRELAAEVLALLQASTEAERVLGESAVAFAEPLIVTRDSAPRDRDLPSGSRIGQYQILREIGRGGMGVIYLAQRADRQFEKQVALKVVKRGMDTDEILARFRQERQILASLEHDGIARLYDGGVTADGRPYLVMEHVAGEPLTGYCDARQLGTEARLRLFVAVCRVVEVAHQRLIVHRDLKPSNILVTAEGHVKLLDFGLARLLDAEAGNAPRTSDGMRILTPEYAAPEQILGGAITTATDVYALGAVLFQLLTGRRPIEPLSPDRALALQELLEREAPRASSVGRSIDRDLDAIIARALEKEPARRYQSPGALAEDILRHLEHQPVMARPATAGYRLRRFLYRHRARVALAAAILALATLGATYAIVRITRERDLARQEAAKAEATAAFLNNLYYDADTDATLGDTLTIGDLLTRGSARIDSLTDQPEVQAAVLELIGATYQRFGDMAQAQQLMERALRIREQMGRVEDREVATTLAMLAAIRWQRGDYGGADSLYRIAGDATRRRFGTQSAELAALETWRAFMLVYQGRHAEALPILAAALPVLRTAGPEFRSAFGMALYAQATLDMNQNRPAEAEAGFREALALQRADRGPVNTATADVLIELGVLLGKQPTRLADADSLLSEGLAQRRRLLGPDHRFTATALNNLARVRRDRGDLRGADTLIRNAIAIHRRAGLTGHDDHARLLLTFGEILLDERQSDSAAIVTRQALDQIEAREGVTSPAAVRAREQLGRIQAARTGKE
jgi:serine/threonine-protein kinase